MRSGKFRQFFSSWQTAAFTLLSCLVLFGAKSVCAAPNGSVSRLTVEIDVMPVIQNGVANLMTSVPVRPGPGGVTYNLASNSSQSTSVNVQDVPMETQNVGRTMVSSQGQTAILQTITVVPR